EVAAKKLGAAVVHLDPTRSSTNKAESIEDTFANLGAMDPDGIIIRHEDNDIARKLADMNLASVINAGAGNRAHPTQALLDLFTLKEHFGELKGKKVAIIGDIANSRVASSLLLLLPRFGVELKLVAPKPFMPQEASCEKYENIADIIDDIDAIIS
ncbi:MAG: aspartate carbamoyltransferase, partial [Sulfurovaceae bacterium]